LPMHAEPCRCFLRRRYSKQIQAQVVPLDPGEQFVLRARPLEVRPWRHPQWIDPGTFVQNLRDVSALFGYGHAQLVVFDGYGHWNRRRSFLASIFATSTPGTFLRSSIDLKAPFFVRYSMIRDAWERGRESMLSNSIARAWFTCSIGTSAAG